MKKILLFLAIFSLSLSLYAQPKLDPNNFPGWTNIAPFQSKLEAGTYMKGDGLVFVSPITKKADGSYNEPPANLRVWIQFDNGSKLLKTLKPLSILSKEDWIAMFVTGSPGGTWEFIGNDTYQLRYDSPVLVPISEQSFWSGQGDMSNPATWFISWYWLTSNGGAAFVYSSENHFRY